MSTAIRGGGYTPTYTRSFDKTEEPAPCVSLLTSGAASRCIALRYVGSTLILFPPRFFGGAAAACLRGWRAEQETIELKEAKKTYDRVFDPSATQQQVFDYVAKPLVSGESFELSLVRGGHPGWWWWW